MILRNCNVKIRRCIAVFCLGTHNDISYNVKIRRCITKWRPRRDDATYAFQKRYVSGVEITKLFKINLDPAEMEISSCCRDRDAAQNSSDRRPSNDTA
jgi:hypothetical protein